MSKSVSYTPEGLFNKDCLACLQAKAKAGDTEAQRALHYLSCLLEFMACRMLRGNPNDSCEEKVVKKMPPGIAKKFDDDDCSEIKTSNGKLDHDIVGFTSSLINDVDYDDRGSGGGPKKKTP